MCIRDRYYTIQFNFFSSSITTLTRSIQLDTSSGQIIGSSGYLNHQIYQASALSANDQVLAIVDQSLTIIIDSSTLSLSTCDSSYFVYCLAFQDLNAVLFKLKSALTAGSTLNAYIGIASYPKSIIPSTTSQYELTTYVYISQKLGYVDQYQINNWNSIIETSIGSSPTITSVQNPSYLIKGKQGVEILVSFEAVYEVPATGTITIEFPISSYSSVEPNCRSAVTQGSGLYSTVGNYVGEIGCTIQLHGSNYMWVITGFQIVAANTPIKIYGIINLSSSCSSTTNALTITMYSNQNLSDMINYGRIISKGSIATSYLTVDTSYTGMQLNDLFLLQNTGPIYATYQGRLKLKLNLGSSSISAGTQMTILLPKNQALNDNKGFQKETNYQYVFGYAEIVSTKERISCIVSYDESSDSSNILYKMKCIENLVSSTEYNLILTIIDATGTELGLTWPILSGFYNIQFVCGTLTTNLLIEVMPTNSWSTLTIKSYITIPDEENYLQITLKPSTIIQASDVIIIELPSKSIDSGYTFFETWANISNQTMAYDMVDSTSPITSMSCSYLNGQKSIDQPVQIQCTNFNQNIQTSNTLQFLIRIINPSISGTTSQIYIPVIVYSISSSGLCKSNYGIVQQAIFIEASAYSTYSMDGDYSTSPVTLGTAATLTIQAYTKEALVPNSDAYLVKLGFHPSTTQYTHTVSACYGSSQACSVIFAPNLMIMIYLPTGTQIAALTTFALANNAWVNPDNNSLTAVQRKVEAYACYYQTLKTQKITYNDNIDFDGPAAPTITLTLSSIDSNLEILQSTDYLVTVTQGFNWNINVISIQFPTTAPALSFNNLDCMEDANSQIEVDRCYLDSSSLVMYIYLTSKTYATTSLSLKVRTLNHAILNPPSTTTINYNQFEVGLYKWDTLDPPSSPISVSSSDDYLIAKSNPASGSLTFTTVEAVAPPSILQVPYMKYVDTWVHFDKTNHLAPLVFDMVILTGTSTAANSKITIQYPNAMTLPIDSSDINIKVGDAYRYKVQCFINDAQRTCEISDTAKTILIYFADSYAQNDKIHVKVTYIDTLGNLKIDGFKWTSDDNFGNIIIIFESNLNSGSPYTLISPIQLFHMASSDQNYVHDFVLADKGHNLAGQTNLIYLKFQLSDTSTNWLLFEIFTKDASFTDIYSTSSMSLYSSGQRVPMYSALIPCLLYTSPSPRDQA
eukprot:TRINITY_DN2900_c0_g2_i1.p1 TRINITY_DN2900_c0_g2~~TRINITY_DN2900_c0_g2_i1.p1  ORF type:complete len:1198 (-),score=132.76 TRINITY_DN2900_c0_g2_i1:149-3742(-)